MDFKTIFSWEAMIPIILLVSLIAAMLCTLLFKNLVKSAISLSALSAVLSIIMFLMGQTLAAVFELSVCAGLVTVLFISTVSMTRDRDEEEIAAITKARRKKYYALPVVLLVITILLFIVWPTVNNNFLIAGDTDTTKSVGDILWYDREIDIVGQIIIILAGAFGVVLLFKERETK
ncbi:MAG: hypothetical protein BGN88_08245 [Clostridiales bacterium 43-6]|nr:MAG: hypothetical protein BGN88_08245 [Clostridiales bacterium 43-6]